MLWNCEAIEPIISHHHHLICSKDVHKKISAAIKKLASSQKRGVDNFDHSNLQVPAFSKVCCSRAVSEFSDRIIKPNYVPRIERRGPFSV
jgi:hypothetical protein